MERQLYGRARWARFCFGSQPDVIVSGHGSLLHVTRCGYTTTSATGGASTATTTTATLTDRLKADAQNHQSEEEDLLHLRMDREEDIIASFSCDCRTSSMTTGLAGSWDGKTLISANRDYGRSQAGSLIFWDVSRIQYS